MVNRRYIELGIAVFLSIAGVFLLIAGFYAVPVGEIHNSILIAYGETLTFVGALLGIDYHYRSVTPKK